MISLDNYLKEALGVIGYAQQTLQLNPEKVDHIQRYLQSERLRLRRVLEELEANRDITKRVVVY